MECETTAISVCCIGSDVVVTAGAIVLAGQDVIGTNLSIPCLLNG